MEARKLGRGAELSAFSRKAGGAAITRETVSDKLFGAFGKHAEREASVPYKGKPNLVTGD